MTQIDNRITLASQLRAIVSMPEYEITFGAWLRSSLETTINLMASARTPDEFFHAQGAYHAINNINQQIEAIWQAEQAALEKKIKV